jgi:enoyl-CoA hydratase/carnithine racemase
MGGAAVLVERHDAVLLLRLNRPERRNAINMAMLAALDGALGTAEQDESIRSLVITGNEAAFSAGQDLKEAEPPDFVATINRVFDRLEALPKPSIAAIDGWCIAGGLELALCCDLRLATPEARIGDWHARINSIGGAGATVRLTRLLGMARAKELIFSAAALEGEAARQFGLVSHCHPRPRLIEAALAQARALTIGSPLTIRFAKEAIHRAQDADAFAHAGRLQAVLRQR